MILLITAKYLRSLSSIVQHRYSLKMKKAFILNLLFLALVSCKEKIEPVAEVSQAAQMCAPVTSDVDWYRTDGKAPLFENLGDLHFPISTTNDLVQRYFNQGMVLSYGFNHAEAARSFFYASKLDPECAMTYWGYAYVLGPNYNAPMSDENYNPAYDAIQKALSLSNKNTTPKEKDLIAAMARRYVEDPVASRYSLDLMYSKAMKNVFEKYPDDADVGTLYAESLMNLHPWDLYEKSGALKEWTPEIISTLEAVIAQHPNHCGVHHFYIHAVEASTTPERGLTSASLFDQDLVPNAGHLVHMPSHIYIKTGDYNKGTESNVRAIAVDSAYVTACHAQGAYPLTYYPHKQHFMSATATLAGNSEQALLAADMVSKNANKQLMREPGWGTLQHYYTIPFYVYVKFAEWDKILAFENEAEELDYPSAMLHYARGMAFVGKNDVEKAEKELYSLYTYAENINLRDITIWEINSVFELIQIAKNVLEAEILAKKNKYDKSIAVLKEAIKIEDALNYNEPPDWFFSVRHRLGSVLLAAGLSDEAIIVYQKDLERLPKNGWALSGLSEAYLSSGAVAKSEATKALFEEAWTAADISLTNSIVQR
jgi:tetratricopeptide (TPR) repeat protein